MDEENKKYTITEACNTFGICRQAIFVSIKNGRLKAEMLNGRWYLKKDFDNYRNSRYDREFTIKKGQKIYDREKGILSPSIIQKIYGVDRQKIYYLIRTGMIPFERNGSSYLIKQEDLDKIQDIIFKKRVYERKKKCKKNKCLK